MDKLRDRRKIYDDKLQENIKRHLNYFENVQKVLDAHATKPAKITLRNQWLEKQKVNNYQNEYDRIRGIIENNRVKGINTIEGLNNRKKQLELLGALAVDGIAGKSDDYYKKV